MSSIIKNDVRTEQVCYVRSLYILVDWDQMCHFVETINDNNNTVKVKRSFG